MGVHAPMRTANLHTARKNCGTMTLLTRPRSANGTKKADAKMAVLVDLCMAVTAMRHAINPQEVDRTLRIRQKTKGRQLTNQFPRRTAENHPLSAKQVQTLLRTRVRLGMVRRI